MVVLYKDKKNLEEQKMALEENFNIIQAEISIGR